MNDAPDDKNPSWMSSAKVVPRLTLISPTSKTTSPRLSVTFRAALVLAAGAALLLSLHFLPGRPLVLPAQVKRRGLRWAAR